MSNIDPTRNRSSFFPASKKGKSAQTNNIQHALLKRNDSDRKQVLDDLAKKDSKVTIPDAVKDFSRIKRAVDLAKPIDNTAKIAMLKNQIQNGTYKIDFDAVADKLIKAEM